MLDLQKDIAADKDKLRAFLDKMERRVRSAFELFIEQSTSEAVVARVLELVQAGQVDIALQTIDAQIGSLATAIVGVLQDSAEDEAASIVSQLVGQAAAPVAIRFDPTNPRAAAIMRTERLEFIREFTDEQRANTRDKIVQGISEGAGPRRIASDFKESIGLTRAQQAAVDNYRRLLSEGNADALNRQLRDRRHDATVRRAAAGGEPLTPDQIATQVERYRRNFLAYRAENIARTEAQRALSIGRQEAMRQNIDAGVVTPDEVEGVWHAIHDKRTRDSHRAMDGQRQPWDHPFISGAGFRIRYPGDPDAPAAETINCRCGVTYRIRRSGGR